MPRVDLVAIIEAIYRFETSQEDWLRVIAEQSAKALGKSHFGAYALVYDASDIRDCHFGPIAGVNLDNPPIVRLLESDIPETYRRHPDLVETVFRKTGFGPSRKLPLAEIFRDVNTGLRAAGVFDILGINGVNVDGRGAHAGALFPRPVGNVNRDALARLSSHLAAGFRLRQRLDGERPIDRAEAVLAEGKVVHATGRAKARDVRAMLSDAAVRLDRIRSTVRRRDPEVAVRSWRALVDARWSLVDHFESGGKRYVLAQRNDASVGPFEVLTERERQVVALAALGNSNKMIGYELGIAVSTVGVLLTRASRRVGALSRRSLIEAYEARQRH